MADFFSASVAGAQSAEQTLAVRANNLANAVTPAFRAGSVRQATLPSGGGSRVASVRTNFANGPVEITDGGFDLAVAGEGFFRVSTPRGDRFTRAGNFTLDANRNLVTPNGERLQPPIQLPFEATRFNVTPNGAVSAIQPDGAVQVVGQLELTRFPNPGGLVAEGRNLFAPGPNSGEGVAGTPGAGVFGQVVFGALEGSNTDFIGDVVGQITDRAAFTANLRVIRAKNQMLGSLFDATA
ncbi:MAG: flagellar hook basal-body protein [Planctomycetes bacterium]|nr:flagellar hook basal-body protein [Planctomycetota bacterium]